MKTLAVVVKHILIIILGVLWVTYGLTAVIRDHLVDFTAFYGAAENILVGQTPYGFYETFYGASSFQSPYWLVWFFVPFTLLPMNLAFIVFGIFNWLLSLVCLIVILRWQISRVSPLAFFYLLGCTLVLCFNAVQFGQASIIQLAAAVVIISALHVNRPFVAGLAIPLVIITPHLCSQARWSQNAACRNRSNIGIDVSSSADAAFMDNRYVTSDYIWSTKLADGVEQICYPSRSVFPTSLDRHNGLASFTSISNSVR